MTIALALASLSPLVQAHPQKCQTTHTANDLIREDDCGSGGAAFVTESPAVAATVPASHPSHNMLLFGSEEIYASHIVYKSPHNFQVILKLRLPDNVKEHYLLLRDSHPDAQIVLLLDPFDISTIATASTISGLIKVRGSSNRILTPRVTLTRNDFDLVFFNELPLALDGETH